MTTPTPREAEREKFEAWAISEGFDVCRTNTGLYSRLGTNQLFSGWLGRAALAVPPGSLAVQPEEQSEQPSNAHLAEGGKTPVRGSAGRGASEPPPTFGDLNREDWLSDLTALLAKLAMQEDAVGQQAEGLGQYLPEIRRAIGAGRTTADRIIALACEFTDANDRGDAASDALENLPDDQNDFETAGLMQASEAADEDYNRTKALLFAAVRAHRGITRATVPHGWEIEVARAILAAADGQRS